MYDELLIYPPYLQHYFFGGFRMQWSCFPLMGSSLLSCALPTLYDMLFRIKPNQTWLKHADCSVHFFSIWSLSTLSFLYSFIFFLLLHIFSFSTPGLLALFPNMEMTVSSRKFFALPLSRFLSIICWKTYQIKGVKTVKVSWNFFSVKALYSAFNIIFSKPSQKQFCKVLIKKNYS